MITTIERNIHVATDAVFSLDSSYVRAWYPSVLGPTAMLILDQFDTVLGTSLDPIDVDETLCAALIGVKLDKWRAALDRLHRFHVTVNFGPYVGVPSLLPPLHRRFVERLPFALQEAYWDDAVKLPLPGPHEPSIAHALRAAPLPETCDRTAHTQTAL